MVDNRFPLVYSVLLSFFASIMIVLMILLFVEYRFFCKQAQQLSVLKEQYAYYIDIVHKRINDDVQDGVHYDISEEMPEEVVEESSIMMHEIAAAESSDAPDDDDEYADDSFVIINRHPDYLKQSTLDYMESQELNALMTAIDINHWSSAPLSSFAEASSYAKASADKPADASLVDGKKMDVLQQKKQTLSRPVAEQQKKEQKKTPVMRRPIKECGFIWPIDANKFWLSSLFGPRKRIDGAWGFHHGVDMAAAKGTAVKSVRAGMVIEASFQAGYGNTVVVQHTKTIKTRYAHLHAIRAHVGQKVKQGVIVGTVGETGFVRKKGKDGSHLHFEVYEHGKRINPMHCLPRMA